MTTAYEIMTGEKAQPNPYQAGVQTPGAQRQPFTTDKPYEPPRRPDVLGSSKWHDTAMEEYPNNSHFGSAKLDHAAIVNSLDVLEGLTTTRDPRMTPAAHAEQVTQRAEDAVRRIEARLKPTVERGARHERELRATLDDVLGISDDSAHGMEIRARLASMSEDDRRNAINRAAQEGDRDVMAAVLNGPSFLTGLSADEKARFKDSYARRHASKYVAELEAVKRSNTKLEEAHFEAMSFIQSHYINRDADPDIERSTAAQKRFEDVLANL